MTTDSTVPGTRRIDRVLSEDYLTALGEQSLAEVRALRDEAEQEEVDLSYIRRLLQGRMDIVRAELSRRDGKTTGSSSTGSRRRWPTSPALPPAGSAGTRPSSRPGSTATGAPSRPSSPM